MFHFSAFYECCFYARRLICYIFHIICLCKSVYLRYPEILHPNPLYIHLSLMLHLFFIPSPYMFYAYSLHLFSSFLHCVYIHPFSNFQLSSFHFHCIWGLAPIYDCQQHVVICSCAQILSAYPLVTISACHNTVTGVVFQIHFQFIYMQDTLLYMFLFILV